MTLYKMFNISSHISPNKVFIINRSKLEGRIDPSVYKQRFIYSSKIYPIVNLSDICFIDPQTSFTKIDNLTELSFIPMNAIDENLGAIDYNLADKKLKSQSKGYTRFQEGDLLWAKITPCMENGKSAIARNLLNGYGFGSTEYFVLRPKSNNIIIDYIYILLRNNKILKSAENFFGGSAGHQRVNVNFLKKLKVPLPPINIQKKIINFYQSVYIEKQQKENEAKTLLTNIDTYLLNELGITLPEKDNTLENRIFTTQLNEVTGGRFDPKLYNKTTTSLKQAIKNVDLNKFRVEKLKSFIIQSIAGDWGIEDNEENSSEEYESCLVIRATEFDNNYNLKLDNSRVKYRLIKKDKLAKIDIRENDLLIEKSGGSPDQPVGRIAIITKDISEDNKIGYSNFIHKIRVNANDLSPEYLFCYLKTIHNIKLTESMQSQTNGIRNLIMRNYFNQDIIIPILPDGCFDLKKQNEIASYIQNIRIKAKALQQDARNILEKAKQQVEQMILGN